MINVFIKNNRKATKSPSLRSDSKMLFKIIVITNIKPFMFNISTERNQPRDAAPLFWLRTRSASSKDLHQNLGANRDQTQTRHPRSSKRGSLETNGGVFGRRIDRDPRRQRAAMAVP